MDPTQIATLRTALSAIGLVAPNATDQEVANAWATYQQQNPSGAQTILQQSGLAPSGPSALMIIGLLGGAVALYLIWRQYQKPKKIDAYDYPEPDDAGPRLRQAAKSMAALRLGRHSLSSGGCRPRARSMGRYGDVPGNKYEFEPESRLEGYRKRKARR